MSYLEQKDTAEHIEAMQQKLRDVGVCPVCLTVSVHDIDEPFSSCACGTGEDYAERPLQKLQRLESGLKDLLEGEPIDKLNRDINGLLGLMGRDIDYCERKGQHLAKILETRWTI